VGLFDCNAFVSVGGDIFNNARPKLITRRFMQMLGELFTRRERAFVFGQSIPKSCQGISLRLLASAFRRLQGIVVRDVRSHKLLKDYGVEAGLTYDTAFVLRPQTYAFSDAFALLNEHGLDPQKTALISLRAGSAMYGLEDDECEHDLLMIAEALAKRGHQPAFLIQSDCNAFDSDKTLALRLCQKAPSVPIIDPFAVQPPASPCDVLTALLSIANIVVAVRYHSAILRLISGRAPFVLYYSNKGLDLSERLNLPGGKLSSGMSSDMIAEIERSADMDFDPNPIARDVTENFYACLQKVA
jgi:polysaccharide pyruvyl transferase WcaK-like protein